MSPKKGKKKGRSAREASDGSIQVNQRLEGKKNDDDDDDDDDDDVGSTTLSNDDDNGNGYLTPLDFLILAHLLTGIKWDRCRLRF